MKKNWLLAALALPLTAFAGAASAATVDRFVIDDGTAFASRNPHAAVDSSGNVHVVSQAAPSDFSASDDIYYYRLSSSGAVLTPQLAVTTGGTGTGRSKVVALSTGKAVVAWKEGSDILAALIDPAGAGTIEEGPITVTTTCTSAGHFSMDAGADDKVQFMISCDSPTTQVYHARLAADLTSVEVVDHAVLSTHWRGKEPAIGVDSGGNLHVIATLGSADDYAMAYAEFDADGVTLIGATPLHLSGTNPDYGHFPRVFVKADDNIVLVWGDKRNTVDAGSPFNFNGQGGTMFQTRIDPANHTGGVGNPGDIDELRVGSELTIGNAWYTHSFLGTDGDVRVVAGAGTKGAGDIVYYKVNGSSVGVGVVSANNEAYQYYKKWMAGAGKLVVWAEGIYVPTLSGGSTRLVAAKVSSFDASTRRKSDSGAPAPLLLLVFGAVALARMGMRRRA